MAAFSCGVLVLEAWRSRFKLCQAFCFAYLQFLLWVYFDDKKIWAWPCFQWLGRAGLARGKTAQPVTSVTAGSSSETKVT